MKLSLIVLAAAAAVSAVYAQEDSNATVKPSDSTTTPAPTTTAPAATDKATEKPTETSTSAPDATTTKPSTSTTTSTPAPTTKKTSSGSTASTAGPSPLDDLEQKKYGEDYHMPYVRVVQARVQSDKPELVEGRFVSQFGKGDLKKGYQSGMDTVNTASVEGALMYVQAEGINQNSRSAGLRCNRKSDMAYVVLYEILIAQTNETIAQYSDDWNVPEYGPMIPMDDGRCTPTGGEKMPVECLMYNGEDGYPNIGPFVGGGLKNNDVRAPYPNTFWFSFPHTCPLKVWGEKSDAKNACRAASRKGLCDINKAPDGVECTFAYDILGWVPIDDVVGISSLKDDSGKLYGNFTTWCKASSDHVEFAGSVTNGKMDKGLPFWNDPLNSTANNDRANKVIEMYQKIVSKEFTSTQIDAADVKNFKELPDPAELAKKNPPCYKTVPKCNTGNGCKRSSFSQICLECKTASADCKTDPSFKFPTLKKAETAKKEEELTSGSKLDGKNGATGSVVSGKTNSTTKPPDTTGAASMLSLGGFAALAVSVVTVLAL